jgi:hypothetical protein
MDMQTITKKYAYKIEPKPEGGFIAQATDPTVPPIEGATREEVQRKIRETVFAGLAQTFPGLKIPLQTKNAKLEFHIDRKPEGGFAVHSTEVGSPTMTPATHEKVDHLTEQLLGFVDKHFPEFSQALAEAATADEVQIVTKQTTGTSIIGLPKGVRDLLPTQAMKSDSKDAGIVEGKGGVNASPTSNSFGGAITNTPITPQASSNWAILRFLLAILAIAGLIYFFLMHR